MDYLTPVDDIQLTAKTPAEMLTAQAHVIEWCDKKIETLKNDAEELRLATEHAKKSKWRWQVHDRHWKLTLKRITYYDKLKEALLNGYYIVPNFPVTVFAIRSDKKTPLKLLTTGNSWRHNARKEQSPTGLEKGEGEYKNPLPVVYEKKHIDGEGKSSFETWAEEWRDEIDFPITMAKPDIMEATSRAMALKIFDQFGILPATPNTDPVIVGQILLKTSPGNTRMVSFMIAWHLNTNVL